MSDTEITIKKSEFEAALREVITEYKARLKDAWAFADQVGELKAENDKLKHENDVLKIDIAAKEGELEGSGNYIHEKMLLIDEQKAEIERLKDTLKHISYAVCPDTNNADVEFILKTVKNELGNIHEDGE
jgi:predicted  nucleic acid-binding Zn-ribbon protein